MKQKSLPLVFATLVASHALRADQIYGQSYADIMDVQIENFPCEERCSYRLDISGINEAVEIRKLKLDVNSDGRPDYESFSRQYCGSTCVVAILVSSTTGLRFVFEGQDIVFLPQKTLGFNDLIRGYRGNSPRYDGTFVYPLFQWDGEGYVENGTVKAE